MDPQSFPKASLPHLLSLAQERVQWICSLVSVAASAVWLCLAGYICLTVSLHAVCAFKVELEFSTSCLSFEAMMPKSGSRH